MSAYYNEHDPFAAAWLRELIREGHIADGDVDERDIRTVEPADLRGYVQCHFFAGIGGWSYALRLAGWPDDRPVWTGSCPCQPFSAAGTREGGADDRHLWPHWARLIRECRPVAVFGEQVESAIAHGWLDAVCDDLEREGYAVGAACLPAASVGAPHIRQRLWFVAESKHAKRRAVIIAGEDERDRQDARRAEAHGQPRACREVCIVADAGGERRQQDARGASGDEGAHGREQDGDHLASGHGESGVADHDEAGRGEQRISGLLDRERTAQQHDADRCGAYGDMGDSAIRGLRIDRSAQGNTRHADITGSSWSACDWLPCRDGKARPIEPGTFPLAHGVSARVGRLRGYGNAIVPHVAAEVIRAYMECAA